ncbi:hypothetical protein [Nocardia sp. NPDC052316]|uniref:hypothetical protein n=1 Tax=Nocardia sp. NPDC052316 TaxID=3364329 RepID=UPI0037C5ACD6
MAITEAFQEFEQNLDFARRLTSGGKHFEELKIGSFDISDLYRSAWVQAVSALDHWVHEEICQRAVALVQHPSAAKPRRLRDFEIPLELFDRVHHQDAPLAEAFEDQLRVSLGWKSFQHPDRIKEGFALVTDIPLWPTVSERFSARLPDGARTTAQDVRERLLAITTRRNRIAHAADRDPGDPSRRARIDAREVESIIDWLHLLASAILEALHSDQSPLGGQPYLLALSDGTALRWVLENDRFAFTATGQAKGKRLEVGDTLFLVTTKSCWGTPQRDTTRIIGMAIVAGQVRDYREPVQIAGREFVASCAVTVENLAPMRAGIDLPTLIPALKTFPDNANYGIKLRNTLVPLSADDALLIRERLAAVVGDPADHVPDYLNWTV